MAHIFTTIKCLKWLIYEQISLLHLEQSVEDTTPLHPVKMLSADFMQ